MTDQEVEKIARKVGISFDIQYHWYVDTDKLRLFASTLLQEADKENRDLRAQLDALKARWRQS